MFSIKPISKENACCSEQTNKKGNCPLCQQKAKSVLVKTLEHLLTKQAKEKFTCLDSFFYCKNPSCKVIYFRNKEILQQEDITVSVGLKDEAYPNTLCYCFNWTKDKIKEEIKNNGNSSALNDIKAKMKNPGCSCEISNPSGRCCLIDVTTAIQELN